MLATKKGVVGVTLVELLIGLVVSLLVILAATSIYITVLRSSSSTLDLVRLNEELRALMQVMASDIRRAGYWSQFSGNVSAPVFTTTAGLSLPDFDPDDAASGTSCILIEYDSDDDADVDGKDASNVDNRSDKFGFRFADGTIQMRDSAIAACNNDNGWTPILGGSDTPYVIETLTFTPDSDDPDPLALEGARVNDYLCKNLTALAELPEPCQSVTASPGETIWVKRQIRIDLAASVNGQRMTASELVRVRNDYQYTEDNNAFVY